MTDPRHRDVAARYDSLADGYAKWFSPVIRPFALPVLDAVSLGDANVVLDAGCGIGALSDAWRGAAPRATVIGVDGSLGMLRRAPKPVVAGDVTALPLRDACADAALSVFVLHHVPEPASAFAEIARVVRPGGAIATVTWGADAEFEAERIWFATLDDYGAAPFTPIVSSHSLLDDPSKIAHFLTEAGVEPERLFTRRLEHRWDPEFLWSNLTEYGRGPERLASLKPRPRAKAIRDARKRLEAAGPDAYVWRPTVVFGTGRR